MRIARALQKDGIEASLMIGTPSNKALLKQSGLLTREGEGARPDDLIIAVKGKNAEKVLLLAESLLTSKSPEEQTLPSTIEDPNLALISVPGAFAAAEARKALEQGMHAMVFSDNVPLKDEVALKKLAVSKGLLLMGPDCGTALITGVPLAFANAVPRGDTGIVSASGTGLQEVSSLLARSGRGVSHGIGVGGRDLSKEVGGLMTLAAIDMLEQDPATKRIIVISKPPSEAVTKKVLRKVKGLSKPVTLCLLGSDRKLGFARTLEAVVGKSGKEESLKKKVKGRIAGLFCGGTLCAEAEIVLKDCGLPARAYSLVDLGGDEYTQGRPHPMIEPELRNEHIERALKDEKVGVILLDVVIGYGAHADPAGLLLDLLKKNRKVVIASVTGTEDDPQVYSKQVKTLRDAGVLVAGSNAAAARLAAAAVS